MSVEKENRVQGMNFIKCHRRQHSMCMPHKQTTHQLVSVSIHTREARCVEVHRLPVDQPHLAHTRRISTRLTYCTNTTHTHHHAVRAQQHTGHPIHTHRRQHNMCMPHKQTMYHLVSVSIHTREAHCIKVHRLPDHQPHLAHARRSSTRLTPCTNTT